MRVLFLIFGAFIFCPAWASVQVYFTPSLECENRIVESISTANQSIDIAVYALNNAKIVQALKDSESRGVDVRILTDKLQAAGKSSKVTELYDFGFNIRVHSKYKLEHNKFAVFDKKQVVTGSYNWTEPASKKNSENCAFITHKKAVKDYSNRFEYLWEVNTQEKSDSWFQRITSAF